MLLLLKVQQGKYYIIKLITINYKFIFKLYLIIFIL